MISKTSICVAILFLGVVSAANIPNEFGREIPANNLIRQVFRECPGTSYITPVSYRAKVTSHGTFYLVRAQSSSTRKMPLHVSLFKNNDRCEMLGVSLKTAIVRDVSPLEPF